jgi:hypothetical protein
VTLKKMTDSEMVGAEVVENVYKNWAAGEAEAKVPNLELND